MRYPLATLARRQRNIRRSRVVLREVAAPATLATDLYQRCYRPIVALWDRQAQMIIAAYDESLRQQINDADIGNEAGVSPNEPARLTLDSPSDIQRELDEGASAFERLFMRLEPELREWLIRVERWQRGRWRGAVLSATGVDIQTLIGPEDMRDTIEAYLRWNTALIRDVSDQARKRIADRVFAGLTQRKPARDVAREIREAVGMARDRSQRIAADQLSKISNSLADERRREAGIDTWVWLHSRKRHPRADHQARDGREYTDATAPDDRPGQLPYCGCRSRAIVTFE